MLCKENIWLSRWTKKSSLRITRRRACEVRVQVYWLTLAKGDKDALLLFLHF